MANARIGAAVHERNAQTMLAAIRHADRARVPTVWLTTGAGPDALTVFAAAASVTDQVKLGTAIVPTFPRHPVVVAQQAADIGSLIPGRLTLGIGPSHAPAMEGRYGIPYVRPLEHVREFLAITRRLLKEEQVDFSGARYQVSAKLAYGADVPVIISALRSGSFELAGEIADGAVTWLCPAPYLRDVAVPAMVRGAAKTQRGRPRLVAHAFVALTTDRAALEQAVNESLTYYPRLKNYQEMFVAAGYPEARNGGWSAGMIDAVVLNGDAATCERKARAFMETAGCEEIILSVLPIGADRAVRVNATLDWIGSL